MPSALAPRLWGGHLIALVLLATACGLGYWQYDAWQTRREAAARDLTSRPPVPLADVMGPDDPFPGTRVGQRVEVSGVWLPESTLYISGRRSGARDGYWAVTLLAVGGPDQPALLVVRGWLARLDDAPPPPEGRAQVVGWLQPPEGTGEADTDPHDDVLPQMRIGDAIQHVDQDLYGAYAVLDVDSAATNPGTAGLSPADLEQLPDTGATTALRNILYSVEWFFFGGFVVFMWWRWVRDQTTPADA